MTVEKQYQLYLKHAGLSESGMHPVQRVETKRTFFAACGQMILFLRDEVSELPEEKAVNVLEKMKNEVLNFFQKESDRTN